MFFLYLYLLFSPSLRLPIIEPSIGVYLLFKYAFIKCTAYSCVVQWFFFAVLCLFLFLSFFSLFIFSKKIKNSCCFWWALHIPIFLHVALWQCCWHVYVPTFNQLIRRLHTSCTWFFFLVPNIIGSSSSSSRITIIITVTVYSLFTFVRASSSFFGTSRVQIQFSFIQSIAREEHKTTEG